MDQTDKSSSGTVQNYNSYDGGRGSSVSEGAQPPGSTQGLAVRLLGVVPGG